MERVASSLRTADKKITGAVATAAIVLLLLGFMLSSHQDQGSVDALMGADYWAGVERQTALGVYRVYESADFTGGDLGFVEAKSVEACLFACDDLKGCVYVSYSGSMCYLKDAPTKFEVFKNRPTLFAAKRVHDTPVVSDGWHDATIKETSHSVYRVFDHTDYEGPDARETAQPSLENCISVCDESPDCVHLTFDGRRCVIKSDVSKLKQVKAIGTKALVKARMHTAPDPLVKQHWTKGGEHRTDEAVYQTWAGCRFKGDDIIALKADNIAECLQLCDEELFCRHVTLVGKECFLHGWAPEYFEIVPGRNDLWAAKQIERIVPEGQWRAMYNGLPPNPEELQDLRSDFVVGQMWDEAETVESNFNRYRMWEGFDFEGGELHSGSLSLKTYSKDECLEECDHKPECTHVVVVVGKECFLKGHPFRLARVIDDRTDVFAGMKLGRKGKGVGLDAKTKKKHDRRRSHKRKARRSLGGLLSDREYLRMPSPSLMQQLWSVVLYGGVFSIIVAGAVWYSRKMQAGFYVNELS